MEKLLKSRKFIFGVLSLIAMILPAFWPETRTHMDKIIPAVALVYAMLSLGTTAEDGMRAWSDSRPKTPGAALQDILDAIEEMAKPPASISLSASSATVETTIEPATEKGNG